MKKIVVAALVVGLGAAAFAAVRIHVYGVCPLTGTPLCPLAADSGEAADQVATTSSAEGESDPACCRARRQCDECPKPECRKDEASAAPAVPAEQP
jgi:hypothetical protein